MLDLRRLTVFREVARAGSFSAAANRLGYSQPAVSHHVSRLEREVGATLLHRHPRSLELTDVGREVLRHADAILDVVRGAEGELRDVISGDPERVRLGGFQTATDAIIRVALERFWSKHPRTRVTLLEADPIDHLDALRAGQLDLAIVFDSPEGSITVDDRVVVEYLHEDPMLVALPAGHRLAGLDAVPLGALRDEPWLEGAGPEATSSIVLLRACEALGFTPDVVFASGNYDAAQRLVRDGMGVALVPELATTEPMPGVELRPVADTPLARRIGTATLRTRYPPPVFRSMERALADAFRSHRHKREVLRSPSSSAPRALEPRR